MPKRTDIPAILVTGAALFVLASSQRADAQTAPKSSSQLSQLNLDAMSDACHAPRSWLQHRGGDEVRFQPSKWARFDKVDCVLKQLKGSTIPMKFGFVGNEVPATEEEKK